MAQAHVLKKWRSGIRHFIFIIKRSNYTLKMPSTGSQ
jgi:hypothetical protein